MNADDPGDGPGSDDGRAFSLRSLLRDIGAYALAEGLNRGGWAVLTPLLARALTPQEFGFVELMTSVAFALLPFIVLGQDYAMQARLTQWRESGWTHAIAPAVAICAVSGLVWFFILQAFTPLVAQLLLPDTEPPLALHLAFAWVCLNAWFTLTRYPFRHAFEVGAYARLSALNTLGGLGIALALVLTWPRPTEGYFLGLICGTTAAVLLALKQGSRWLKPVIRGEIKDSLNLGARFIPNAAMDAFRVYLDRLLVTHGAGLAAVGVYAISLRAALLLQLPLMMFSLAWVPRGLAALQGSPKQSRGFYRAVMLLVLVILAGLAIGVTLLAPEVVYVLGGPEYEDAALAIGPLAAGVVGSALGLVSSIGVVASRRPGIAALASLLGLATTVAVGLATVPHYGMVGAACASASGQWAFSLCHYFAAPRLVPAIRWDHRVILAVGVLCMALALFGPLTMGWPLLFRALICLALCVAALFGFSQGRPKRLLIRKVH